MKVKDILAEKGTDVITTQEDQTIFEAMATFASYKVGSLLVLNRENQIVGIVAARDVLMAVFNGCEKIKQMKVNEIMTKKIIIGNLEDELEYVEAVMTENRIRHLPIIEKKKLSGIVSIGDVVKAQLKEYHVENRYLKEYIEGKYPG